LQHAKDGLGEPAALDCRWSEVIAVEAALGFGERVENFINQS